jgi:hypothetical protein
MIVDLPETLETRIAIFIEKLKGQIAQAEALGEKGPLPFLENIVRSGTIPGTQLIYDFDAKGFKDISERLLNKYFFEE